MSYEKMQPWQKKKYDKAMKKGPPGGTGVGSRIQKKIRDIFHPETSHNGNVNDNGL
tara:strand:+ start:333 stop:500 length:168 start_codon:yes stop_codon:yes gene_type:complete